MCAPDSSSFVVCPSLPLLFLSLPLPAMRASAPAVNASAKPAGSLNFPGSKKCSSAKSSSRLFCSGVPVSKHRNRVSSVDSVFDNLD